MAIKVGESATITIDFKELKNSGEALNELEGTLKKVVTEINNINEGLSQGDWTASFLSMSAGLGASLLAIVAVKDAFAGVKSVITQMDTGMSLLVGRFATMMGTIALVVAAIAVLAAGILYLWNTNETFRNGVVQAWEAIKSVIETVISTITVFVAEKLAQIKAFWDEHGASVMQVVSNIFTGIMAIIQPVMDAILAIMQFVWPFIVSLIQMVWGNIQGVISGALNIIMGLVKTFAGLFTGDFSLMWEGVKQLFFGALEAIWNLVQLLLYGKLLKIAASLFKGLMGVFSSMWSGISNLFLTALNGIKTFFSTIFMPIQGLVGSVMTVIRTAVTNGLNMASGVVQTVLTAIRTVFLNVFNAVRNVVSTAISFVSNFISTGISAARTVVTSGLNAIRSTFMNIFNAVRTSVSNAMTNIRTAISNGIQSAWQTVMNFVGRFRNAGRNIVTSIADGIRSAIGSVTSAISNVAGKIRDFLPFSPAKEGPLQDIHRLNFGGPIKDSINGDIPIIERAFTKALVLPDIQGAGTLVSRGLESLERNRGTNAQNASFERMTVEVPVHLEGKQIAKVTAPFMDAEFGRRGQMAVRARGRY